MGKEIITSRFSRDGLINSKTALIYSGLFVVNVSSVTALEWFKILLIFATKMGPIVRELPVREIKILCQKLYVSIDRGNNHAHVKYPILTTIIW